MLFYFDSSALAKRFHTEPGSQAVDEIFSGCGNHVFTSHLALVELTSVAAIKVRTGAMTLEDAGTFLGAVATSAELRQFIAYRVREEDYDRARALLTRHARQNRLRTLDSLHLAFALRWSARNAIDFFVTADRILAHVAALEGFAIIVPGDV